MRSVPAVVFALALAAPSSFAPANAQPTPASARPNFTGTWLLDVRKSWSATPKRAPLPMETIVVRQSETELSFSPGLGGGPSMLTVPVDGKKHERAGRDGLEYEVSAKWEDGVLVLAANTAGPSFVRFMITTWSLGSDGKELTISGTSHTHSTERRPNETVISDTTMKRVYRKQ